MRARFVVSSGKQSFSLLSANLRKLLFAIFFCAVTMQCDPNVLTCLRSFRRQFCFEGCLDFLVTLVYHSQTARKWLCKGFLVVSSLFTRFSSSLRSFWLAFLHPNLPKRFKNIRISRLHQAFSPPLVRNIQLVRSGYFFFYPDNYGINIRFTSA